PSPPAADFTQRQERPTSQRHSPPHYNDSSSTSYDYNEYSQEYDTRSHTGSATVFLTEEQPDGSDCLQTPSEPTVSPIQTSLLPHSSHESNINTHLELHDSPVSTNEPLLPPDVNPPPSSLLHAQHTLQHTDADILISDQQTLQSDDTQTVQQEHTQRPTANDITPTTHTATGDASR
ncbi:hypothetical protein ADUPG1_002645, partial [Aduncisulcus paluster]